MKYRNAGYTIIFSCPGKDGKKFCDLYATYKPSHRNPGKYMLKMELKKTIRREGNIFKFEHPIDTQMITAKHNNVKNNISRIVDVGISRGLFNKEFEQFAAEIAENL